MSDGPPESVLSVFPFTGGPFVQTGYVLRCERTGRAAFVDPGAAAPRMVEFVRESGARVDAIFLTHGHLDHVDGLAAVRAFTDAPIHMHPDARPFLDLAPALAERYGLRLEGPLPPPDRAFVPGETVQVGEVEFQVRFAPGHAPGHVILYAPSVGVALVGDVVFAGSIGRTDLPGGDFQELMASIRAEILTLPDDTRLLPGHGPETTVGVERMGNPFLIPQTGGGFA